MEERAAEDGAEAGTGAILALCSPIVALCSKYSVMSGEGAEEDLVACPLGSTSLFLRGLPIFS